MRRLTRLAAVALTLLVAACGEAEEPTTGEDGDQPVQAPADRSPGGGAGAKPAEPARCRAVSRRLVERSLGAARSITREAHCPLRVVIEGGRSLPITDDFSPGRINVRVDDGNVTEILGLF